VTHAKPARVLHVVGALNHGGVETWLVHVVRHSDPARVRHDFIAHSSEPGAYDDIVKSLGSKIFPLTCYRNPIAYHHSLTRHLRQTPYDVVHSHVHHFSGVVLRAAHAAGIRRRIAHSHNDTTEIEKRAGLTRQLYLRISKSLIRRYATHHVAASREAAQSLTLTPEHAWTILYCGHDFGQFHQVPDQASVRAEFGIPEGAVVLGHVGRFDTQKNHEFLLRIAAAFGTGMPNWRLLLVGDGPLRSELVRSARTLGISDQVIFAGIRSDVPRLLISAMDVFLFPSIHEGLPLACTEAQAAGLPLVISDVITRELDVVHGIISRMSLKNSPSEWAATCARAAAMMRPRAAALKALETSSFSIGACLERLEQLYESAESDCQNHQHTDAGHSSLGAYGRNVRPSIKAVSRFSE
jgi:glycosyltransferase involved in cell wall biosynthesis